MFRIGFAMFLLWMTAGCSNEKKDSSPAPSTDAGMDPAAFARNFPALSLPYQLSDSALLGSADTVSIRDPQFAALIPDSLTRSIFGPDAPVKYSALGSIKAANDVQYYLVKGSRGGKQAALLLAFRKKDFGSALPFLVVDSDPTTAQVSTIDASNGISRNVVQKRPGATSAEGKEVFTYDAGARQFRMILVNPIDNGTAAILNPIDSFARTHKFAGDYVKDRKNFVSIRDGRNPNELRMFIHLESGEEAEAACTGELTGDLILVSPTAAVFRKSGDPCVMNFRFTGNSVTVAEEQGCGSHRGLTCAFDGSYPLKKEARPKPSPKKKKS